MKNLDHLSAEAQHGYSVALYDHKHVIALGRAMMEALDSRYKLKDDV